MCRAVVGVLGFLLLLWIFCVAVECGDKEKRDVHRIVIKEGRPINHHKHHHHHHHHKPKHHHNHHEEEHFRKNHSSRLKRRNKPSKKITTTTTAEPQEEYTPQENKLSQFFTDEWTPILGKNNQILQNPQKYDFKGGRNNAFSRRQTTPKPKFLHEMVDITTEFPGKRPKPHFEKNKTKFLTFDSESSEESSFFDDPKVETSTRKKKGKYKKPSTPGYEVYEDVKEDVKMPHPSSFRLNPIFNDDNDSKFGPFSQEDTDFFAASTKNHTVIRNFGKKTKAKRTRSGGGKRN